LPRPLQTVQMPASVSVEAAATHEVQAALSLALEPSQQGTQAEVPCVLVERVS